MALEGDQAVLPAQLVLTVAAQRVVPVQELEVALQYRLDLHLPLCGAAGMQEVYHCGQALQGQPREPRGLGFCGHLAAPRFQDREEALNRVRGDREKAVLLKAGKKKRKSESLSPLSGVVTEQSTISEEEESRHRDLSSTDHCSLEMNQPQCEELWDLLAFPETFCGEQTTN